MLKCSLVRDWTTFSSSGWDCTECIDEGGSSAIGVVKAAVDLLVRFDSIWGNSVDGNAGEIGTVVDGGVGYVAVGYVVVVQT